MRPRLPCNSLNDVAMSVNPTNIGFQDQFVVFARFRLSGNCQAQRRYYAVVDSGKRSLSYCFLLTRGGFPGAYTGSCPSMN